LSKLFKYGFVLFLMISVSTSRAQEYEDDAQLWLNLNLEKKINDNFDFHFSHSSRINNNVSQYGLGYGDIGVSYKRNDNIKVMLDYVLRQRRNLDGSYGTRHRAYFAVILKKEISRFTFSYRYRFQAELRDLYKSEEGLAPRYYDRHKVSVKYELNKRFDAYVSEELYYPWNQAKNKGFDRSRSAIGLIYKLSKRKSIEGNFTYRHELNAFNRTNRDFIYSLTYSYEF
jgi:hypothetical protein